MAAYDLHERAASLIADAGGQLVGRTRLQKVAFLTQLAGFGDTFEYEYRHYGPYSEELADAMKLATGLRLVSEEERRTTWGGRYSIFQSNVQPQGDPDRQAFIAAAADIGAIELELAATAAFLFEYEGFNGEDGKDPWQEVSERKPEKASFERIENAKAAYHALRALTVPIPLPDIA